MLDKRALVLEGVTLGEVVEFVVEVLVDLSAGTVLDEQAAEDAEAAHPQDLAGHTGVGGTLALTEATVPSDAAGQVELACAGARVHGNGLADDETIGDELADRLPRVGVGDLRHLVGVEPNLALTAAEDGRSQALLGSEVDPVCGKMTWSANLDRSQCGYGDAYPFGSRREGGIDCMTVAVSIAKGWVCLSMMLSFCCLLFASETPKPETAPGFIQNFRRPSFFSLESTNIHLL